MTVELASIPASEFIRRVIERTGTGNWFLLALNGDGSRLAKRITVNIAEELADEVVDLVQPASADDLMEVAGKKAITIVYGVDSWSATEWSRLDVIRSRLLESHKVVWIVSTASAIRLFTEAPHFARFFTGSAWEVELDADEMSEVEREGRVKALEEWAKMSTEEMAKKAEARELSDDPRYVEWLALIGRSDLL